jgi:hypothetical protein
VYREGRSHKPERGYEANDCENGNADRILGGDAEAAAGVVSVLCATSRT